jgi:hypothetical protein
MTTSTQIDLVSCERIEQKASGDVLGTIKEYVSHVFGDEYYVAKHPGEVRIPQEHYGNMSDVHTWWSQNAFTFANACLLIIPFSDHDRGGVADGEGTYTAAVVSIDSNISNIAPPSNDSDLIGKAPTTGWEHPAQISGAIHEILHLYGREHPKSETDYGGDVDGYCDNHNYVNYFTPMLTGYGRYVSDSVDYTECADKVSYSNLNQSVYVEGVFKCSDIEYEDEDNKLPEPPAKTFTASEVNSIN